MTRLVLFIAIDTCTHISNYLSLDPDAHHIYQISLLRLGTETKDKPPAASFLCQPSIPWTHVHPSTRSDIKRKTGGRVVNWDDTMINAMCKFDIAWSNMLAYMAESKTDDVTLIAHGGFEWDFQILLRHMKEFHVAMPLSGLRLRFGDLASIHTQITQGKDLPGDGDRKSVV